MTELLAGNAARTEAIESTKKVSGSLTLGPDGKVQPGSQITLDLNSLASDRQTRDNFVKRVTLQTNQFPNVEFVPKEVQGLPSPLPASGQAAFKLLGDATIRGVTRPLAWDVTATLSADGVQGQATSSFKLSDFGITPPKAGPVISVDDAGKLDMKFQASRSAA
jgi:polyisoprenoid-binding protein YceI